jgi:hypothetical protein
MKLFNERRVTVAEERSLPEGKSTALWQDAIW